MRWVFLCLFALVFDYRLEAVTPSDTYQLFVSQMPRDSYLLTTFQDVYFAEFKRGVRTLRAKPLTLKRAEMLREIYKTLSRIQKKSQCETPFVLKQGSKDVVFCMGDLTQKQKGSLLSLKNFYEDYLFEEEP